MWEAKEGDYSHHFPVCGLCLKQCSHCLRSNTASWALYFSPFFYTPAYSKLRMTRFHMLFCSNLLSEWHTPLMCLVKQEKFEQPSVNWRTFQIIYHCKTHTAKLVSLLSKYMLKPHSTDISDYILKCYYSLLPTANLLCQQKTEVPQVQGILAASTQQGVKPKATTRDTMCYNSQAHSQKQLQQHCVFFWGRKVLPLIPAHPQNKVFSASSSYLEARQ